MKFFRLFFWGGGWGGVCGFGVLLFDPNKKTQCGSASIILMLELAQLEAELLKLSSRRFMIIACADSRVCP